MSQIKIPSAPVKVLKIGSGAEVWIMQPFTGRSGAFLTRISRTYRPRSVAFDGGDYLEAFMAVREPEDALAFVRTFGSFAPAPKMNKWGQVAFSEFKALQELVRAVAQTPLSEWPPKELPIGIFPEKLALRLDTTPFTFVHETELGIEACCAQVFFEKLAGVEFRWCARRDCEEMFRKETGHDKIYCKPECGHLVAVRASRDRANKNSVRKKGTRKRA